MAEVVQNTAIGLGSSPAKRVERSESSEASSFVLQGTILMLGAINRCTTCELNARDVLWTREASLGGGGLPCFSFVVCLF